MVSKLSVFCHIIQLEETLHGDNILMALVSVQRTSDLLASQSFGGHHGSYSSYGCCDEGVDPATLIALLTGKKCQLHSYLHLIAKLVRTSLFQIVAVALATYFLRLQIVILMRGRRSANGGLIDVFDELVPPINFPFDTFEPSFPIKS